MKTRPREQERVLFVRACETLPPLGIDDEVLAGVANAAVHQCATELLEAPVRSGYASEDDGFLGEE
ncbi:MAG: hypothetical protein UX45_C0019G0011 [Candidatus Uhrbacteria bacterium GW2011_GWF2_46_218]|uniref:Uncharacterized protein n=1 Tax=Candidatus Uhrbacteria bacterium GW2011_GWF2_46_218 TaxID=1619001 RepID=A0A0G1RQV2_9BACT|nr:MAG: hypothetical protein UX45_C0019G0011 [Candidatus Uhrbacteria bacterium GW2011_GWF2_46_218]